MDAPRCFAQGDVLNVEDGYSADVKAALADKGHNVQRPDIAIGGSQAILLREDGVVEAGSDPRKDGCAIGF